MLKFVNVSYDIEDPCEPGHVFLTHDELKPGGIVVVDTSGGLRLGVVVGQTKKIPEHLDLESMRYVVDTVDLTRFNEMKKMSEQRRAVQLRMDIRAAELEKEAVYAALAEKDADMKALLEQYKELQE